MAIYWKPKQDGEDPNKIDVWHVQDDETITNIGAADVSDVRGMPDSIGGVAPDAVRRLVERKTNKTGYETDRRTQFHRGQP